MELKQPLVEIACRSEQAETTDFSGQQALDDINFRARQTLRIVDGFLLHAQTDYGQQTLPLEPTTLGSVVYDAYAALLPEAKKQKAIIDLSHLRKAQPIMANKQAVTTISYIFGTILLNMPSLPVVQSKTRKLLISGYKSRSGKPAIGVFSNVEIHETDFREALKRAGSAQMPWADATHTSQASIAVAEGLCKSIGGNLGVAKRGKLCGIFAELQPGQQLALV